MMWGFVFVSFICEHDLHGSMDVLKKTQLNFKGRAKDASAKALIG